MKRKHLYLAIAILGLVSTGYYNLQFFQTASDTSVTNFIRLATTTYPAQSLGVDILVVVLTFFAWYIPEAIQLKMKHWWVFIPLTFMVAIAVSFPLFLYFREQKLAQLM